MWLNGNLSSTKITSLDTCTFLVCKSIILYPFLLKGYPKNKHFKDLGENFSGEEKRLEI